MKLIALRALSGILSDDQQLVTHHAQSIFKVIFALFFEQLSQDDDDLESVSVTYKTYVIKKKKFEQAIFETDEHTKDHSALINMFTKADPHNQGFLLQDQVIGIIEQDLKNGLKNTKYKKR